MRIQWSYIAGFFDGEGCIYRTKTGKNPNRHVVSMAQAEPHEKVIFDISEFLSKNRIKNHVRKGYRQKAHHADHYALSIYGSKGIVKFLTSILPYSIVKKSAAKDAIICCQSILDNRSGRRRLLYQAVMEYSKGKTSVRQLKFKYGFSETTIVDALADYGIKKVSRSEIAKRTSREYYKQNPDAVNRLRSQASNAAKARWSK